MSNSATSSIGISDALSAINPLYYVNLFIDKLQHLPVEDRKPIEANIPDIIDIGKQVGKAFADYHIKMFKSSSEWSMDLKLGAERVISPLFFPISWCQIGESIRDVITKELVGNLIRTVAFVGFQFFHALPYILILAITSGTIFLYQTKPAALLTCLAGSLLTLITYYIFRLVKEIELTNQILDQRLKEVSDRFDMVLLVKNTTYSILDLAKRVIKTTASLWPFKNTPSVDSLRQKTVKILGGSQPTVGQ